MKKRRKLKPKNLTSASRSGMSRIYDITSEGKHPRFFCVKVGDLLTSEDAAGHCAPSGARSGGVLRRLGVALLPCSGGVPTDHPCGFRAFHDLRLLLVAVSHVDSLRRRRSCTIWIIQAYVFFFNLIIYSGYISFKAFCNPRRS
jgi:hypothetical protein